MLTNQDGVEDIVYYEDIVQSLSNWINSIKGIGGGIIAYLTVESILVILVIIGLQIASRREEIEILRLLGATDWFIAVPFFLRYTSISHLSQYDKYGMLQPILRMRRAINGGKKNLAGENLI